MQDSLAIPHIPLHMHEERCHEVLVAESDFRINYMKNNHDTEVNLTDIIDLIFGKKNKGNLSLFILFNFCFK